MKKLAILIEVMVLLVVVGVTAIEGVNKGRSDVAYGEVGGSMGSAFAVVEGGGPMGVASTKA